MKAEACLCYDLRLADEALKSSKAALKLPKCCPKTKLVDWNEFEKPEEAKNDVVTEQLMSFPLQISCPVSDSQLISETAAAWSCPNGSWTVHRGTQKVHNFLLSNLAHA